MKNYITAQEMTSTSLSHRSSITAQDINLPEYEGFLQDEPNTSTPLSDQ